MEDVRLFYGHLVYFIVIWYVLSRFGIIHQQKSGNPVGHAPAFFLFSFERATSTVAI
jgi:hypothetical protein